MFYLPDRVRPWENEYVERVIKFFAGAYGRPAKFTADASGTARTIRVIRSSPMHTCSGSSGACRC